MKTDRLSRWVAAALAVATLAGVGCTNHVVHRERGYDDYRQQDFAAAADDFQKAVTAKPSDYQAQYYLGVTQLKLDQPVAAQMALEQALALRSEDPAWRPRIADALAEAYYQQERVETLYAFLDNMVQTYHQQTVDYLRQAKYLGLMGDADGQKAALEKAAYFAGPEDETPYLALADFFLLFNDVPGAVAALKHAYYVAPKSEEVKDRLRGLGVVPGPTIAVAPPKPALVD